MTPDKETERLKLKLQLRIMENFARSFGGDHFEKIEMARMVLPLNIYTMFYATWDLKNLLHFITLREDAHAQAEIQEYGKAMKRIMKELFPWTIEAYEKYKWVVVEDGLAEPVKS
jgi:flavin-dependent thymidylate synthase